MQSIYLTEQFTQRRSFNHENKKIYNEVGFKQKNRFTLEPRQNEPPKRWS
jgi:hypothetical protein